MPGAPPIGLYGLDQDRNLTTDRQIGRVAVENRRERPRLDRDDTVPLKYIDLKIKVDTADHRRKIEKCSQAPGRMSEKAAGRRSWPVSVIVAWTPMSLNLSSFAVYISA